MKAMVIYDSYFGNTEKVARAIGEALGPGENVQSLKVSDVKPEQLEGIELLIVGSPTRAFRATAAINGFLKKIPAGGLRGVQVAGFDTRISTEDIKSRMLLFLVKIFGYAAEPISKKLQKKGGEAAAAPEGFIVKDTEGPLKDGELERAAAWAKKIAEGL
jgi:flavodoxin